MSTAQGNLTDGQVDARIRAIREHREAKAATEGSVPAAVRMTADDIASALDGADPARGEPAPLTPREKSVLDAARSLYGGGGVARPSEIAASMNVENNLVSQAITSLRGKGRWPYSSPRTGRPPNGEAAKPKAKNRPNLACLDEPKRTPSPAVEAVSAAPRESGVYRAMLAALDAVNALPDDARTALTDYLVRKG